MPHTIPFETQRRFDTRRFETQPPREFFTTNRYQKAPESPPVPLPVPAPSPNQVDQQNVLLMQQNVMMMQQTILMQQQMLAQHNLTFQQSMLLQQGMQNAIPYPQPQLGYRSASVDGDRPSVVVDEGHVARTAEYRRMNIRAAWCTVVLGMIILLGSWIAGALEIPMFLGVALMGIGVINLCCPPQNWPAQEPRRYCTTGRSEFISR